MKTTDDVAALDASTPGWPVVVVDLRDPASVTVNGVTSLLTGDAQAEAVAVAARQARTLGRPVRMAVTAGSGDQRLLVSPAGVVVPLPDVEPEPAVAARPIAARFRPKVPVPSKAAAPPKRSRRRRLPLWVRLAVLAVGVLSVVSLVVLVVHGKAPKSTAAPTPVVAVVPPAGQLYTDVAPPGWSQQAKWVVPIVEKTVPATDPATGVTAAVTPLPGSTSSGVFGQQHVQLSILNPDGSARWVNDIDAVPTFGPVITKVDGATVALVGSYGEVRYWNVITGAGVTVALPQGARVTGGGESPLITLQRGGFGYLHAGAVATVDALPRTDPGVGLDGGVLVTQPDNGTWWVLRADAAPASVRPAPPDGAGAVDKVLGVTASRVLISWKPAVPDPKKQPAVIVAGYDRASGALLATTTALASALGQGAVVSNDSLMAVGTVVLSTSPGVSASVVVVPSGFTATVVADRVYGTSQGKPADVWGAGNAATLPVGSLVPSGDGGEFLPVVSGSNLYALVAG